MRFTYVLFASMILSAAFGTALARHADQAPALLRADTLSPSFTWLWKPQMRRVASAY